MSDTLSLACKSSLEYTTGTTVLGMMVLTVLAAILFFLCRGVYATFWSK